MSSIFDSIDQEVNVSKEFWSKAGKEGLEDVTKNLVKSGILIYLTPTGVFKKRFIVLTKTRIYSSKHEKILEKVAVITWKHLEAFNESNGEIERFGFRLSRVGNYRDFYTQSAQELESWLDALSSLLILSDIESDYTISEEIGTGSYGKVYKSQNKLDHKTYAVKSISKQILSQNPSNLPALISEITTMRQLDHPSLVKLYRVYESEDFIHLVLDYVQGGDLLQRILIRSSMNEETASKFMKNLLETLQYMHSNSVIHRDLKPDNILLLSPNTDFDLKIADFGLACECKEDQQLRCGSPGYIAPEILKRMAYGTKVDMFSAGVLMYIILSGRTPFFGKNANEILLRNRECKIYFQEKYWKNTSPDAIDLILKLTDCNPEKRITAEEALKHPWFKVALSYKKNHENTEKKNVGAIENPISAELMSRINRKNSNVVSKQASDGKGINKNETRAKKVMGRLKEADI